MMNCVVVGIGGFLGAVCRYLLGLIPVPVKNGFPLTTLIINLIGAFLIGVITELSVKNGTVDSHLTLLLKVGVCGGFTTFSTFSLETSNLLTGGRAGIAAAYMALSVAGCILAVLAGRYLVRAV